jgi:protein TonB
MSTAFVPRVGRQAVILSAIAGMHLGAFVLVSSGVTDVRVPQWVTGPIFAKMPDPPKPPALDRPKGVDPGTFVLETQPRPVVDIPSFEEETSIADGRLQAGDAGGATSRPAVVVQPPRLRTPDARLKALMSNCYPGPSRRLSEEGRVVARAVIGVDGRPASWAVDQGSGFPRLDAAADCVIRRLEFVAGRRDGNAVEATVRLPIVFELR